MSAEYAERRARLLSAMGPGVMVVPAAPVAIRNNDVEHAYRQDSDFYYLTGFDEPESVLVLTNQHDEHQLVLFVRVRNPEREIWDGPRAGVDGAMGDFGADAAYPIGELAQRLPDYLTDVKRLHYRLGRDHDFDSTVFTALDEVRRRARLGKGVPTEIVDPAASLHELRLVKADDEIEEMKRAAEVTREAHIAAMGVARPGRHEFEVEAEMLRVFRKAGCERPAYDPIVGSGRNATILHYRKNDRLMEEGDLLLIDAGCELGYYASDVTRTFPVSGTYTPAQRALYDLVLASQNAAIDACVVGANLDGIHEVATNVIVDGLLELGLLSGDRKTVLEKGSHKAYYMHRTSHWIGMDVHDVGAYYIDGKPRPLAAGYVLTVEPGIYVGVDAVCDAKWRGIGIRIEDDILVTADGPVNLTAEIPKDPEQVERILAERV
jgi:Xaa-Pro aminopeptidase